MLTVHERSSDCLSDLALDRLRVGELQGAALQRVRSHLETCVLCQANAAALERDAATFAELAPAFPVPTSTQRTWRTTVVTVTLAIAATLALLWLRPPSPLEAEDPTLRIKGTHGIDVHVRRADQVFRADGDTIVYPGDRLRISTTTHAPTWFALVGVDGRGTIDVYHPAAAVTEPLPVGAKRPLEMALELDDAPGPETLFAIFCDVETDLAALRDAVALDPDRPALPAACTSDRIVLEKHP